MSTNELHSSNIQDIYTLSPLQQGMYFHALIDPESTAYVSQLVYRIQHPLDPACIRRACSDLLQRHDVLRTVFSHRKTDEVVQIVLKQRQPWLHFEDLSHRSAADADVHIDALLQDDRRRKYDLSKDLLLRLYVLQTGKEAYTLIWSHHHILMDGWCASMLLHEFNALYAAHAAGTTPRLPPAPPFADFIRWLSRQDRAAAAAFWSDYLEGYDTKPALQQLPVSERSQDIFEEEELVFSLDDSSRIRKLAEASRVTLNIIFQGIWGLVFGRYTDADDIVFGEVTALRPPEVPHIERMIGLLINTVPVRVRMEESLSAAELFGRLQAQSLRAHGHTHYPLAEIQSASTLRQHLIDMLFITENFGDEPSAVDESDSSFHLAATDAGGFSQTNYNLNLILLPGLSIRFRINYNTAVYKGSMVRQLLRHFRFMLEQVLEDVHQPLGDLQLLQAEDINELMLHGLGETSGYAGTIGSLFRRQAQLTPQAIAIRTADGELSYAGLLDHSNALAIQLGAAGVVRGDCVSVLAGRSVASVESLLAIAFLGAIYVPLEPGWPDGRLSALLETSGIAFLLAAGTYKERLPDFGGRRISLDGPRPAAAPVTDQSHADDAAYLIFTSGTTGLPKGVPIRHESIVSRILYHNDYLHFGSSDRMLQFAAVNFDASLVEILMPLFSGGTLCLLPDTAKQDLAEFHGFIDRTGVTAAILPPAFIRILDRHPLSGITKLISTGEAAIRADLVAYASTMEVYNGYGPTEVCIGASFHRMRSDEGASTTGDLPIGRPFADTGIFVADRQLRLLPKGATGEICISGIGLTEGYWKQPELTEQAFVTGRFGNMRLYRTGDLGRWNEAGELEYLGRLDDQVQINGIRVEVSEIRECLCLLPGISNAQVRLVRQGEHNILTAYIITRGAVDLSTLDEQLARRLPAYMIPACFLAIEEFPLSPNGKVDWSRLPQPEAPAEDEAPARNELEVLLFDVVASVLHRPVSGTSDFLRLGGDSIKAIQVVSRLHRKGLALTVKEIFEEPVLGRLSAYLRNVDRPVSQAAITGTMPLTPIVAEFLTLPLRRPARFNQGMLLQSFEPIDAGKAFAAVQALCQHHDGLRIHLQASASGWELMNEGPGQEVSFDVVDLLADGTSLEENIEAVQESMDLKHGPLFKARIFRTANGDRLLLLAHHLIVDGVSWRILLEDLEHLYRQARSGESFSLPPKTDSFRTWAQALTTYAQSPEMAGQEAYWRTAASGFEPLPLPVGNNAGESVHSFRLDTLQTTALLEQANAAFHTETSDLLIAALGRALQAAFGLQRVRLTLEGHGREPIVSGLDVSRTVGWFTSLYPFVLPPAAGSLLVYLQSVKEQLRAIPGRGIGWGILRHLSNSAQVLPAEAPSILFNYLGQFHPAAGSSLFAPAPEPAGVMTDPDAQPFYPVAVSARVTEGRLSVALRLDRRCFEDRDADRLGEDYQRELSSLIDQCCAQPSSRLTPSDTDFPLMPIGELDVLQHDCERRLGSSLEAIYPLTPMQEGMLFHCLSEPASDAYLYQVRYRLSGTLDRVLLDEAVQQMVARHAALRTVFRTDSLPMAQLVLRKKHAPVRWVDIRSRNGQGDTFVDKFIAEDAAAGFRLGSDTLLRLTVFQQGDTDFSLVWTSHHLVLDGWCLNILLSEFAAIYTALLNGHQPQLPPAAPFRNYVRWINQQPDTGLSYWLQYLDGYEGTMLLPTRKGLTGKHEKHTVTIGQSRSMQLNQAAQALRVSLSTMIQTTWGILLARYNDTQDVVFGSVTAGRPPAVVGIETMIGLFINTLPLRVRFEEETTFGDLVRSVQADWLNAERYQFCPLVQIQSALGPNRALAELVFDFTNYPALAAEGDGTEAGNPWKLLNVEARERTHYAFFVSATAGKTIDITFHYDAGLYSASTIKRIGDQFLYLLGQVAENKWTSVGSLRLSSLEEEAQLLNFSTGPRSDAPIDESYTGFFEAQAAATPDAVCVVDGNRNWTYREVDNWSSGLAAYLQNDCGLSDGGVVAVALDRGAELIASIMGIWKAGGVYLPVHPDLPFDRVTYMLQQAQAQLIIGGSEDRRPDGMPVVNVDGLGWNLTDHNRSVAGKGTDAAYLLYTSGSTGTPKGAVVEQRGLMNHLHSRISRYGLMPGVRVAQTASQSFDISIWQMMAPLLAGATVVVIRREEQVHIAGFLEILRSQRINILQMVPTYADQLLNTIETARLDADLPDLRLAILVGEELKPVVAQRWHDAFPGKRLINTYGPTEAADTIADFDVLPGIYANGVPIGHPIDNTRLYVLDRQGRLCPPEVPGEIFVSGPGVGPGYIHAPDRTAASFGEDARVPGQRIYATGDLGSWSEEGRLHYHGRRDHQVKINGHRVELGEIENALLLCTGVAQAAVVYFGDNASGDWKGLAAYVQLAEGQAASGVLAELRLLLPAYMVPAVIVPMEALPVNINGKADRKRLPRPQPAAGQQYEEPASKEEELLLSIWREVLGNSGIGLQDHFIEAGGDSIRAMQVSARCHAAGYRADLNDFFEYPTIALLAPRLRSLEVEAGDDAQGTIPLTPIQARFFSLPFKNPDHYNQSFLFALEQRLAPDAAQGILDALLRHHDALRARFPIVDGRRAMVIDPPAQVPLVYFNWRGSGAGMAELQTEAQALQTGFDLGQGPLFRAALFSLPDADRLFIVAHHLVIDGVSWRILHDDMNRLLRAYLEGGVLELPRKTTSYHRWALELTARRHSNELLAERSYWHDLLEKDPPPFPFANADAAPGRTARAEFYWDRDKTRRFLQAGAAIDYSRPHQLLLAAFVRALYDAFGLERMLVDLELHGREQTNGSFNLSRTIGWFTTLHPVLLKRTAAPSEQVGAVGRALAAAPNGGMGYGLLRYLPDESGRQESFARQADIVFNYLGQFDTAPEAGGLVMTSGDTGASMGEEEIRAHTWNVSGFVADGCLCLRIDYCVDFIEPDRMEAFAAAWERALSELLDNGVAIDGSDSTRNAPFALVADEDLSHIHSLFNPEI